MAVAYTFAPSVQPDWGIQHQQKPTVLKAQFGDGYSQRVADGHNNRAYTLSLTWTNLVSAERDEIVNFFKARRGYEAFYYTYQDENSPNAYICVTWSSTFVHSGIYSVTATFNQVYD